MKSEIYELTKDGSGLEAILAEVDKAAVYGRLDKKQSLHFRLLAEELLGMLPELLEFCSGKFWIEGENKSFELHVSVTLDDILSADRDRLMDIATSHQNSAAKGIMGKIRAAAEMMLVDYLSAPPESIYDFYGMGIASDPLYFSSSWTLNQYKLAAQEQNEDAWDELEKSIVANIADDVIVGIKGTKVDIIVKKTFADF